MGISKASVSQSLMSVSRCLVNLTLDWITYPSSNVAIKVRKPFLFLQSVAPK